MLFFSIIKTLIRREYGFMGKFSEEEQPVKRRGKSGRTLVLEGIKAAMPTCKDKDEAQSLYFKEVAKRAFNAEDKDSVTLLKWMGDKGWASLKSVMEKVEFELDESGTPIQQAKQVLKAASDGVISPDIAQMFIGSISGLVKIDEVTEIRKELEDLKEMVSNLNG